MRTILFASLLSGAPLASAIASVGRLGAVDNIEEWAADFSDDVATLALGLDVRAAQLDEVQAPTEADLALASESLALLVPLADHVGLSDQRARLEDASFRILEPDVYDALSAAVPGTPETDATLVETLLAETRALLVANGIEATFTGRTKSLYGVHRKLRRKGVAVDEIADRLGLRICVEDEETSYVVAALLNNRYEPAAGTWDDYIASPKPSGYQSLHTALRAGAEHGSSEPIEFQIRTHRMHEDAERGDAAHWRYKLA